MNELMYVSSNEPGYCRKGRGKGFEYFDLNGNKITDNEIIQRLTNLAIPPVWKDVWVCPNPYGHLQVTGIDAKGRKQYLYHESWTKLRNESKYHKLIEFARTLPEIRRSIDRDLRKIGWPREKVLALVVSILDESYLRIGNKTYQEQNETYGLTTLRRKHLEINGSSLTFQFKAKSGKYRKINIRRRKLIRLIKECSQLPGYEVFQYMDNEGVKHRIGSHDVNEYLNALTGEHFTAKDFRTWGGTVLAVKLFEKARQEQEAFPRRKFATILVRKVAEKLGNTVAICRDYYIHPCILGLSHSDHIHFEKLKKKAKQKYKRLGEYMDEEELTALYLIETKAVDQQFHSSVRGKEVLTY